MTEDRERYDDLVQEHGPALLAKLRDPNFREVIDEALDRGVTAAQLMAYLRHNGGVNGMVTLLAAKAYLTHKSKGK